MAQQQKEWYKKWWGIVLAVLLLPFFIIWFAWVKSSWSKTVKIVATVLSVILILIALGSSSSQKQTSNNQTSQNTQQQTTQEQSKQVETKKDDSQLKADVKRATDVPGIEVTNLETVSWNNCQLILNSDYKREIRNPLTPNEPLNNPYALFTKDDGTKFNSDTTAVKTVLIRCEVDGNTRYGVYEF